MSAFFVRTFKHPCRWTVQSDLDYNSFLSCCPLHFIHKHKNICGNSCHDSYFKQSNEIIQNLCMLPFVCCRGSPNYNFVVLLLSWTFGLIGDVSFSPICLFAPSLLVHMVSHQNLLVSNMECLGVQSLGFSCLLPTSSYLFLVFATSLQFHMSLNVTVLW